MLTLNVQYGSDGSYFNCPSGTFSGSEVRESLRSDIASGKAETNLYRTKVYRASEVEPDWFPATWSSQLSTTDIDASSV